MRDLYADLGCEPTATLEELKAAFRTIAKLEHPDRNGGKQSEKFIAAAAAWEILGDADRRRVYDAGRCTGDFTEFYNLLERLLGDAQSSLAHMHESIGETLGSYRQVGHAFKKGGLRDLLRAVGSAVVKTEATVDAVDAFRDAVRGRLEALFPSPPAPPKKTASA